MAKRSKQSYWRIVWRQFRKKSLAMAGLVIIVILGVIALFAPFIAGDVPIYLVLDGETYWFPNLFEYDALLRNNLYQNFDRWEPGEGDYAMWPPIPHSPRKQNLRARLEGPSAAHPLGTDDRGRDVLSRMVWGTRISMSVGFVAVGISVAIGIVLGALAGYYGGKVDAVVLRLIEIFITFPSFFLILTVMAFLPPSIYNIMVVIGITGWTGVARLVRGEFFRQVGSDYVVAARAGGLGDARIIFRHVLPNAVAPVFVTASFGVAGAILTESGLSVLGFGVPPPAPSWGEILKQARQWYATAWWLVVYPGLAIFITVTAFNLVGDGLRDAMDPRLRK
jgi:peptide/nickel transport system permease protein